MKKPWTAFFNGELVYVFRIASDAINQADCKKKDAAENAENSDQPDKHIGRIFIAIHY